MRLLIYGLEEQPVAFNIILLRGLAREKGHWGDFPDRLGKIDKVDKVIGIDLPGNGDFYKITSPLSIGEMAEFVHSHSPWKELNNTIIISVSLGSMVATEILHRYESSYAMGFHMNTSFSGLSGPFYRLQPKALETFYNILRNNSSRNQEEAILNLVSNSLVIREKVLPQWTQLAHSRPTSLVNAFRQLVAAGRYRSPVEKPRVPLYLLASKKDRMVHCSCSESISEHWNLPLTFHPSAGHELALDDPDWVCEQVSHILSAPFEEGKNEASTKKAVKNPT